MFKSKLFTFKPILDILSSNASYSTLRTLRISDKFYNRNPRNLELLNYAKKTQGWQLQAPRKDYYLKCILNFGRKMTSAQIEHSSGVVVVRASTGEAAIGSELYKYVDVNAARNVGSVLARRCLQAGIQAVMLHDEAAASVSRSEKVRQFREAMESAGLVLEETPRVCDDGQVGLDYEAMSEAERQRVSGRCLLQQLRDTPDRRKANGYFCNMRPRVFYKTESCKQSYEKVVRGAVWNKYYGELYERHHLPHWDPRASLRGTPVSVGRFIPGLKVRYPVKDAEDQ